MQNEHPNANVEIVIVPGAEGKTRGTTDGRKIRRAIERKLLLTSKETYRKVQVEVEHGADGTPKALMVSMLRAHTYTADIVRLGLDAEWNVTSVEPLS